jgi:DNA replication regulator SLD3
VSVYTLQTRTMLHTTSRTTLDSPELPIKPDTEPTPRLPSKRKRDTICGLETFNKPFTIKPCPESPYDKPHNFKPVRVISRSQLPLSFLDTSADETLAANRLFSAHIDVLERHSGNRNSEDEVPKVLIARYESKRTLYAVERVQARVYSLCKLAGWLKEKDVTDLWDPETLQAYPEYPQAQLSGVTEGEWWKHAMVDTEQAERREKRVRMSMLQPQLNSKPESQSFKMKETEKAAVEVTYGQMQPAVFSTEFTPETIDMPILPTPQEQLESLVEQYLNAIYLSKMSLAYFVKGPITRTRNAFTSSEEGAPPTHELVSFLRSMLLSHKAEEKKYREKLQEVVKAIPPGSFSEDELVDISTRPKRSKKKVKLSREGVYPQETKIVKQWWISEMPNTEAYGEETMEQRLKRRLADLRVREALAQMILILEIVSLESLATYKGPLADTDGTGETQTQSESQAKPKKRKKKLDDVNLLLDLLLDKLCIWQSVEQEGVLEFDSKSSNQDAGTSGTGQNSGNDRLQSFCIEVIIPFYINRLPEQARAVNKKLGGPANSSPPKRKAMKPPTMSRKSGEPKGPDVKKVRRSFGRVATDTTGQTGQRRATPSLSRSATDSALISGVKREGSEMPLSAIPFQRSPSNAVRQSMSHMKLLKGREIDLDTTSAAVAAKLRQKKRVEEDLQEAITALKKPNRGLAAGSYADDLEKRGVSLLSKSRKATNPVRKIVKDVQVSATPRAVRTTKEIVNQTPIHQRNPFVGPRDTDVPSSRNFCIPSSGARPPSSMVPGTVQRSATSRTLAGPAITETPSKPPASRGFLIAPKTNTTVFATPSKQRAVLPEPLVHGVNATPTKAVASSPPNHIAATPRALFATPVKPVTTVSVTESPFPALLDPVKGDDGPSIYDALGWNDDDDFC